MNVITPATEADILVLRTVSAYIDANGYSPTIREICQSHGWRSPAAAHGHIRRLVRLCLLSAGPGPRTIRVTEAGRKLLEEVENGL